jgi:hypothetical protein
MGHRKLAALLKTGENRVKRVMKKYGIEARRKKKRYVYPGKASSIVPNALRDPQTPADQEVMFLDIFEVQLADRTRVRGCFALWKQTRHCLSLAFDYQMRADLVVATIDLIEFSVPGAIFHSDLVEVAPPPEGPEGGWVEGRVGTLYRSPLPDGIGWCEHLAMLDPCPTPRIAPLAPSCERPSSTCRYGRARPRTCSSRSNPFGTIQCTSEPGFDMNKNYGILRR